MSKPPKDTLDLSAVLKALEHFNEQQLLMVDEAISQRLKALHADETDSAMRNFRLGDSVWFEGKKGQRVTATVVKLNRKTIGVVNDEGRRWKVSPQLLTVCPAPDPAGNLQVADQREKATVLRMGSKTDGSVTTESEEWIGGVCDMPGMITGEGPAYRPKLVVWMDSDGMLVGSEVFEPGQLDEAVVSSLQKFIAVPMVETAKPPTHLRVSDQSFYNVLVAAFPQVEVTQAATPELDEVLDSMREHFAGVGAEPMNWLSLNIPTPAIAAFFEAAAGLYKVKPWECVPSDESLVGISIDALGLQDAVLSIIGQQGETFGFILFDSFQVYTDFVVSGDAMALGLPADIPAHTALNFVSGAELDSAQRKQIAHNHWKVAGADAYPEVYLFEKNGGLNTPTTSDLDVIEALCRAIAVFLKKPGRLRKAWSTGRPVIEMGRVLSYQGQLEIKLTVPAQSQEFYDQRYGADSLITQLLQSIGNDEFESDSEYNKLVDELEADFTDSPEGRPFQDRFSAVTPLLDFAYQYLGVTPANLYARDLEEVLFEILPRKYAVAPEDAADIINSVTAFFKYLKREHGLPQAETCLALLKREGLPRLTEALGDTSNFSPAKAMLAHAEAQGYDVTSQAGIDAWLAETGGYVPNSVGLPGGLPVMPGFADEFMPPPPPSKPVDKKSVKKKRKAARKARRRKK